MGSSQKRKTLTVTDLKEAKRAGITSERELLLSQQAHAAEANAEAGASPQHAGSTHAGAYPHKWEAEEQILDAIFSRVSGRIGAGGRLEELGTVLSGEYDDGPSRMPVSWVVDDTAEMAGTERETTFAGVYHFVMVVHFRVFCEDDRDPRAAQRDARRLASKMALEATLDDAGGRDERLGLGFVTGVSPGRSSRLGLVSEGVFGHEESLRVRYRAVR